MRGIGTYRMRAVRLVSVMGDDVRCVNGQEDARSTLQGSGEALECAAHGLTVPLAAVIHT